MPTPTSPAAERLAHAGQQLREQLQCLETSSQQPAQPLRVGGLLAAFDAYAQAVLSCLPPPADWPANPHPTPVELLAEREQSPLYRLGWVRGYRAGKMASQATAPLDPEALLRRVRVLLAQMQQRYGAGPLTQGQYTPSVNHFRIHAPH